MPFGLSAAIALYSVGQNETPSFAPGFVRVVKVSALYSVGQNKIPVLRRGVKVRALKVGALYSVGQIKTPVLCRGVVWVLKRDSRREIASRIALYPDKINPPVLRLVFVRVLKVSTPQHKTLA
jgi:hypothetical protein